MSCVCHLLIYSANGVYPTGAVCRIILHNKHDFIKTIFALDACFQQELFQQTISWRVLPEQGKRLTLDRGCICASPLVARLSAVLLANKKDRSVETTDLSFFKCYLVGLQNLQFHSYQGLMNILKSSYFYIVSRQEETRFTRFKNPPDF